MTLRPRTLHAVARLALLGAVVAGLGFSCDGSVNDSSVALLVTVRASLGQNAIQGGGDVPNVQERIVALSQDGRYVAFASKAPNLVPGDNNGDTDIFLRDMILRTTVLISVNQFGTGSGNGASGFPSVSANGRYVAYSSTASNLHPEDADAVADVYVRDVVGGTTILVSRSSGPLGDKGNAASGFPAISADGRYVAFESLASNLDGIDPGGDDDDINVAPFTAFTDIYRRDILDPGLAFPTVLISRASTVLLVPGVKGTADSARPRLSANGRFVCFESDANNLVTNAAEGGPDANGQRDCFLRDVDTSTIRRVSLTTTGADPLGGASDTASVSDDGRFIAYRSNAANIHPDDDGTQNDVFLFDAQNGAVIICSQHTFGTQAGNSCSFPVITFDGRYIVFQSGATALVNGDNNSRIDIFRHDRVTRETTRLSVGTYGAELNGASERPAVSGDGQYVAFVTDATNAADDDSNGAVDVYLRGPPR